ncbi:MULTISPECIES: hypothetical protein [unclassified Francisella]|uniref:hypothetical protein n=1 Tax=unclassified Francisella TaxID=2610885 RepID=UPI002E31D291|nr:MULTISPECIES: hypothetical protein [unclassified Francisella]MED7818631.1 hypothetical protein [Francisella sp. 19S2-4]MED7829467.1 hypothetical protein [Francisella sp. 19S2-10]
MKNKIPLTIALTASMSFGVALAEQANTSTTQGSSSAVSSQTAPSDASCGSKCASGSCGSNSKSDKTQPTSQKSVKAQDSSCGSKCASGSCGSHAKSNSGNTDANQVQDSSSQDQDIEA